LLKNWDGRGIFDRVSKQVSFLNSEGERLIGDLDLPATKSPSFMVIICHGFLGTRHGGGRAVTLARRLATAGFGVFRFDFAGSGESEGDFARATLTKNVDDLTCALNYLEGEGFQNFLLLGRSFGGNAVLACAANDSRVRGVCLWSSSVDMIPVLKRIIGEEKFRQLEEGETVTWSDGLRTYSKHPGFLEDLRKYQMRDLVARISPRPLLIVHGEEDQLVPVTDARELFQAAGEPKELVVLPGGDHHLKDCLEQAIQVTLNWLQHFFSSRD